MNQGILPTFHLSEGTRIAQAQPPTGQPVTLQSPGRSVMTDLTHVRAATVAPDTPLAEARQTMILQGVRLLFVVRQAPGVEGLITSTDLEGERAMKVIARRGIHFDELVVSDVMSPLATLEAIDLDDLARASVGEVVHTLAHVGRRHMIVIQKNVHGEGPRIRGVISVAQIERQLGRPIEMMETASNFAEISSSLATAWA